MTVDRTPEPTPGPGWLPIPDFASKLRFLAEAFGLDEDKLASDIRAKVRHHETWTKLTDGHTVRQYTQATRRNIATVISATTRIKANPLWLTRPLVDFKKKIAREIELKNQYISLRLSESLVPMAEEDLAYLQGKYRICRYSLSNLNQVALEWMVLSREPGADRHMNIKL